MKHKVKSFHWNNGILEIRIRVFETLEEAVEFAISLEGITSKIYNALEELITEIFGHKVEPYA